MRFVAYFPYSGVGRARICNFLTKITLKIAERIPTFRQKRWRVFKMSPLHLNFRKMGVSSAKFCILRQKIFSTTRIFSNNFPRQPNLFWWRRQLTLVLSIHGRKLFKVDPWRLRYVGYIDESDRPPTLDHIGLVTATAISALIGSGRSTNSDLVVTPLLYVHRQL